MRRRAITAALARCAILVLTVSFAGCAPGPVRTNLPAQWRPSPNFGERRPDYVIIHHTGSSTLLSALATLRDPNKQVSAHYLIARDGTIYQLVDERERAWHAGDSRWGPSTDLNSASIGIELDNNGEDTFPDQQISSLLALLADVCERYNIPRRNVLGHADVAPRRKDDPSAVFPWDVLAASGFGLWCRPPYPDAAVGFDAMLGLRAIGYDISDPEAALHAFRLHFNPGEVSPTPTEQERALIQCLAGRAAD